MSATGSTSTTNRSGTPTASPWSWCTEARAAAARSGCGAAGNPHTSRIVLFDQRGCGRSTPHAAEHDTSLEHNTTTHLVGDIEKLRRHLGIERWLVLGGSWGERARHRIRRGSPERVQPNWCTWGYSCAADRELAWMYNGARRFLPMEHEEFSAAPVPAALRDGDSIAVYNELLNSSEHKVRQHAADAWMSWEDALISLDPDGRTRPAKQQDPELPPRIRTAMCPLLQPWRLVHRAASSIERRQTDQDIAGGG